MRGILGAKKPYLYFVGSNTIMYMYVQKNVLEPTKYMYVFLAPTIPLNGATASGYK